MDKQCNGVLGMLGAGVGRAVAHLKDWNSSPPVDRPHHAVLKWHVESALLRR